VSAALRKGRWAFLATALFVFPCSAQELCAACHGPDGNSPSPQVPSIAGQPKLFLEAQLVLIREGVRRSEQMASLMKGMKDAEIVRLAGHFSKLAAKAMEAGAPDARLMQLGMEKAATLRCGTCHLADFGGQNQVPRLAGQREAYLEAEMRAYRDGKRAGGDTIMAAALYGVGDADIRALAHFLSRRLSPSPARPPKSAP